MIVLGNDGKVKLLENNRAYLNTLDLRLLKVNVTLDGSYVFSPSDEVDDGGYVPVSPTGFTAAYLNGSDKAQTDAPTITFVFNHDAGDQTIYAEIWTDPAAGDLFIFGQKEAAPFTVTAAGQTFSVAPHYTRDTAP